MMSTTIKSCDKLTRNVSPRIHGGAESPVVREKNAPIHVPADIRVKWKSAGLTVQLFPPKDIVTTTVVSQAAVSSVETSSDFKMQLAILVISVVTARRGGRTGNLGVYEGNLVRGTTDQSRSSVDGSICILASTQ
jgi:hypothetical protein